MFDSIRLRSECDISFEFRFVAAPRFCGGVAVFALDFWGQRGVVVVGGERVGEQMRDDEWGNRVFLRRLIVQGGPVRDCEQFVMDLSQADRFALIFSLLWLRFGSSGQ
jgi:hypothetical protein